MALNERRAWIIAYDIRCPRRLSRLHRFIKREAVPVQYSIYLYEGSAGDLGGLLMNLRGYIDDDEDDVRAYPIPRNPEIHHLGIGSLPPGALLHSADMGDAVSLLGATAE